MLTRLFALVTALGLMNEAIAVPVLPESIKPKSADQQLELDRFIKRMVTEDNFAGDAQWDVIQKLTREVTAKASELAGKKFQIPDFDMKSLPQQLNAKPNEIDFNRKRILLSNPETALVLARDCVILSAGPTPRVNGLTNCIVIVDGDFTSANGLDKCLLIVRGKIGRVTSIRNCIILATGDFSGATLSVDSFYQVGSRDGRFTVSQNNVFIKSNPRATREENSRVLDTERGPLQLLRFSDIKKQP